MVNVFFYVPFNIFEISIVGIAMFDVVVRGDASWLWRSSMLRLVRIFRVWETAGRFKALVDLWLVLCGLARATRALIWLGIVLSIVVFAAAAATTAMVRQNPIIPGETPNCLPGPHCIDIDEYFGSVPRSALTMMQLATRDSWASHVVRPLMLSNPAAAFILSSFVVTSSYGLLSVAVGVLVWSTVEIARKHEGHAVHKAAAVDKEIIFGLIDYFKATLALEDKTEICSRDLQEAISVPQVAAAFKQLELPVQDVKELFSHLDRDRSGAISMQELETGIKQMKQPATRFDVACMTAQIGGSGQCVDQLKQRCKHLHRDLDSLKIHLGSAFAELSCLIQADCSTGQVPEVILRRAGRIQLGRPPAQPRYSR